MDNFFDINKIISVLRKSWWVFAIFVVYSAAASYFVSSRIPAVYRAKTTLMVGEFLEAGNLDRNELQVAEALSQTYSEMVHRQRILQGVLDKIPVHENWRYLGSKVSVNLVEGTQLFEISVDWGDQNTAQILAGELAKQMVQLSPNGGERANNDNQNFVQQEIDNLQTMIETGQEKLQGLESQLNSTTSEEEKTELEGEIASLQSLLISWQNTYAQMLDLVRVDTYPNKLSVVEESHVDPKPIWPQKWLLTLLGAGLGLALAFGFVFTYEFVNRDQESIVSESPEREISLVSTNGRQTKSLAQLKEIDTTIQSSDQLLNALHERLMELTKDIQKLEVLTLKDAANYLNLEASEAFHLLQENGIPIIQVGSVFRVRREDLETFVLDNMLEIKKDED